MGLRVILFFTIFRTIVVKGWVLMFRTYLMELLRALNKLLDVSQWLVHSECIINSFILLIISLLKQIDVSGISYRSTLLIANVLYILLFNYISTNIIARIQKIIACLRILDFFSPSLLTRFHLEAFSRECNIWKSK